jgi:hypothetical protein
MLFHLRSLPAVLQEKHAIREAYKFGAGAVRQLALLISFVFFTAAWAVAGPEAPPAGKSRALIVVGLPGDEEHAKLFAETARRWRDALSKSLEFEVTVLFGRSGQPQLAEAGATRESIEGAVAGLKKSLGAEDRLWVLFLGHGDHDGERASFHLSGRDLHADDVGKLFAGIKCREQVFWLTHSASSPFLKPLSVKGRIVVTANAAEEENNETEFPQALASVLERLDAMKDAKVSVLEVYRRTVAEVEARFAADKRVPTEHAQLDDNGDGVGTEEPVVEQEGEKKPTADGRLAARTFLPFRKAKK